MNVIEAPLDRILSRVIEAESGCWEWQGARSDGYGHIALGGKAYPVHRVVYESIVGPIPLGLCIDHLCRNRACCNPAHLEPVTVAENSRRSPIAQSTINANKTHCMNGHPFNDENTYIHPKHGWRKCRPCANEYLAAWRAAKREAKQ